MSKYFDHSVVPRTLAVLSKRTIWIWTGVPASDSMNCLTPFLTVSIADPIEPESSMISVSGPPQRLCVCVNVGALRVLSFGSVLRVVPPAVRLIWLIPPPPPSASPPPLIVTTTRFAFLVLT